jgi:hypothetical protein
VQPIGPYLDRTDSPDVWLHFRHRGSAGALVQAGLFFVVGVVFLAMGIAWIGWANIVVAVVAAAGAVVTWLAAWDIRIDPDRRVYEIVRGTRFAPRRVLGSLDDFAAVRAEPATVLGVHIYLVPKGSRRGYDLMRGYDRAGAREAGRALAAHIGLPFEESVFVPPTVENVDLRRPPAGLPVTVAPVNGVLEIDLSPGAWIRREWVRVSNTGIEVGADFIAPWGRRFPSATSVPWSAVMRMVIAPAAPSGKGPGPRGWRRLKRDRRAGMGDLWEQRCAELKTPASPVPWWRPIWYLFEGHPLESEKTVCIVRDGGTRLAAGSSWRLGRDGIEWLFAGLVTWGRARGGRFGTQE